MTFIVAIPCNGGVVLASDGQSKRIVDGRTIKEKAKKIFELGNNVLWGCAGDENGRSRFVNFVDKHIDQNNPLTDQLLVEHLENFANEIEGEQRRKEQGIEGLRCPEYLVVGLETIWCMYGAECQHVHYSTKKDYEVIKGDLFAIGAGQAVPRAFFDGLKKLDYEYTLAQGSLVAYRLVGEAIKSSDDVGKPIYVWTVVNNKPKRTLGVDLEKLETLCYAWVGGEQVIANALISYLGDS